MKIKIWLSRFLLGFVFVTIGFALGRQTADFSSGESVKHYQSRTKVSQAGGKVAVYSAHMTFRCWECNQIEWLVKELLDSEFGRETESGVIEYRSVDYMKDVDFARRYDIASSTLVLVRFEDGDEAGFERLDGVWTKSRNRDEFMDYVREAILFQLARLGREAG